jgi:DNA-binding SARP family transcriptional activator
MFVVSRVDFIVRGAFAQATRSVLPALRTRSLMPLLLKTLGGLTLEVEGAPSPLRVRRRPLVLLAFITGAGRDGVSREKALAYFWPDSDEERARSSLRQSLFTLRREVGAELLSLGEHTLRVDASVLRVDAWEFEEALARHDYEEAARWYGGPFLDGVSLSGLGELDIWIDARRRHFDVRCADALRALVADAVQRGDIAARVRWARQLAAADPLSVTTALALLEALGAAGDRTAALDFGRVHAARIRSELGLDPDPAVTDFIESLRRHITPTRSIPALDSAAMTPALPAEWLDVTAYPAVSAEFRAIAPPDLHVAGELRASSPPARTRRPRWPMDGPRDRWRWSSAIRPLGRPRFR